MTIGFVGCDYAEEQIIIGIVVRQKICVAKCDPTYVQELLSMTFALSISQNYRKRFD